MSHTRGGECVSSQAMVRTAIIPGIFHEGSRTMATDTQKLAAFPVFMRVENRSVVIVGNGDEALAKARLLGQSSATLTLVADAPEKTLADWAEANDARLIRRPTRRAISRMQRWSLPRPMTRRRTAPSSPMRGRAPFPSTRWTGPSFAISTRRLS
ncbi:uroporphyrinogen-III C-methyltransferase [Nitratireductor aquibiodomus RA22]|uniref:Uroporphyrinogen-III C-methyltransferase n=1 Tax=Nitratireductor aquibiodomus RA22 TaxID=1189611 RepID=I5BPX0_9HYPH|nr:uroporphyrinogen-III C-methyltransferase [Nitratireductor aquibiodomus RA22]